MHAALMPMFDDIVGEQRFVQLLDSGEGDLVTNLVRFRGDHWEGHQTRDLQRWPKTDFDDQLEADNARPGR